MGTDIFVIIKVIMKCVRVRVGEQGEKRFINLDVTSACWEDAILFSWLCSSVFLLLSHSLEESEKQRMKCQEPRNGGSAELRSLKIHRKKTPKTFRVKGRCFSQSLRWKMGMQGKIVMKHEISSPRTEQVLLAWHLN